MKKVFISLTATLLFMFIGFGVSAQSDDGSGLKRISKVDPKTGLILYGYADARGKVVIEPQYLNPCEDVLDSCEFGFSEGLAPVKTQDGEFGYINTRGEMELTLYYKNIKGISNFYSGTAYVVFNNGEDMFIDTEGNETHPSWTTETEEDLGEIIIVDDDSLPPPPPGEDMDYDNDGVIEIMPVLIEEEEVEDVIFTVVEEDPQFPGGMEALFKFIEDNIQYPQSAKDNNISGRVFVTFVVEKDGSITGGKILRDICNGCGAEALRLLKIMPKWTPGKQRGHVVRTQYNLPIKFGN